MPDVAEHPPQTEQPKTRLSDLLKPGTQADIEKKGGEAPPAAAQTPPAATPPKTEEAKPAEVKPVAPTAPDPDEEIIAGKRSPKSDDFKRVKTAAKKAQEELEGWKSKASDYETKLKELEKRPVANADEIAALKRERDEAKTNFEVVALELSPEFQQKYATRIERVTNSLKDVLSPTDHAKVTTLLHLPESEYKRKALAELAENLDQFQIGEISAASREMRAVLGERQAELANSNTKLGEIVASRKKAQEDHRKALESTFDEVFNAEKSNNPLLKAMEGDTPEVKEWNQGISERAAVAKAIFRGELNPKEMADMALKASSYHVAIGEWRKSEARIKQLEAALSKLQGAAPGMGGGGGQPAPDAGDAAYKSWRRAGG